MVKLYDRFVLPATRAAERVVRPPFGQSVFAVARVPEGRDTRLRAGLVGRGRQRLNSRTAQ